MDLSFQMVIIARRTHPHLHFIQGSLIALSVADASLGGVLAWYSTIHVPHTHLPTTLDEFARALAPGGHVQLAFQAGTETEHRTEAGTHPVYLDFHHRQPERMADPLTAAGLEVQATLQRAGQGP